ncbi:tandem-95 repeat protein [bacterium]|nr:tandem-95 repeat protein [bacterium]
MLFTPWLSTFRNAVKSRRNLSRRDQQVRLPQVSELLEARTLLTSPQFVSVSPNVGEFVVDGQVRSEAPRELVLQFSPGQTIDSTTLGAIQITAAGHDGEFRPASELTDFGTGGAVVVRIGTVRLGAAENGTQLVIDSVDNLGNGPTISSSPGMIALTLDNNMVLPTTAADLIDFITNDTTAKSLLSIELLSGNVNTDISGAAQTLTLAGAGAATAHDSFGVSDLTMQFRARNASLDGNLISLQFLRRDLGSSSSAPLVNVVGNRIEVTLNDNTMTPTTAGDLLTAISGNAAADALITAAVSFGDPATSLAAQPDGTVLHLSGADAVMIPGYRGVNPDSQNEVFYRFAENLTDDDYRIQIVGAGASPLTNTNGEIVNNGTDSRLTFTLDLGAQVEGVVPQPVLRDQKLTVNSVAAVADGDMFLLDPGTQTATFGAAADDFGSGGAATVQFTAVEGGTGGNGIRINVLTSNLGIGVTPTVTVDGRTINITVNSLAGSESTAQDLIDAVTASADASALVTVSLAGGSGAAAIGATAPMLTSLVTSGAADVFVFEFNDTSNDVTPGGGVRSGNIAINFDKTSTSPSALATLIRNAINSVSTESRGVTAAVNANVVTVSGAAFDPRLTLSRASASSIALAAGGIRQIDDTIIVYFNNDTLDRTRAQDPKFYRAVNVDSANQDILLPATVTYSNTENTAVLKFASSLPTGVQFRLDTGTSNEGNGTITDALDAGTIFADSSFEFTAFLGAINGVSTDVNDVDLFSFNLTSTGDATVTVAPVAGLDTVIRLFQTDGTPVGVAVNTGAAGATDTFTFSSLAAGDYIVGVSSNGNDMYDPVDGSGTGGGSGFGSYKLTVSTTPSISADDFNSSFDLATELGRLGLSETAFSGAITPQTHILMPPLPGAGEPGHRDLPPGQFSVETNHGVSTGTDPVTPGPIATITFNFPDVYGLDVQGNILHNVITANQKQRAREIFELFSWYTGLQIQEVSSNVLGAASIAVITGDVRAVEPTLPPNNVGGISDGGRAIINANINWGQSEFGGAWMGTALHEIGHSLGLGHSYDIVSTQGGAETPTSGASAFTVENFFTGEYDYEHLLSLYRPDASDIDMYRFTLDEAGTVTAEIRAERDNSNLDSNLILYREEIIGGQTVRKEIARNDNYYSNDSFLNLNLPAGTYYIGVTAHGNDLYNPSIEDSGQGGTTDGAYTLSLNFSTSANSNILDETGTRFDGDRDGAAGGKNQFWFRTDNTIFVDSTYTGAETGSAAQPYNEIDKALAAAGPGDIVRIIGNGGADNDVTTLADNDAYLVGLSFAGNPLQDGAEFKVPQDVTVMIDAGVLMKLRGAVIDAGTSAVGVDRSHGAVQVLGTPHQEVYFSSYRDDAKGGNSDGVNGPAAPGDWGGIVFRQDSDSATSGVFLNVVNHATMEYGGGQANVDSVVQTFDPIHMVSSRPAATFNTIMRSANAAMSANPDSFDDSLNRIGPDIYGNLIVNNSLNGLFVRILTQSGVPVERLTVQGRFDDTDIVHIVTENLQVEGSPGGPLDGVARLSGRLAIDPGVIVKLQGSRLEAERGASNIIAEGTPQDLIRFTALRDDQFGAGGTFDTSNDGGTVPVPGDWGGFMFNPTSGGSLDYTSITYGGGSTPILGGSDNFNAVEIVQAQVRVANSSFENNAGGLATSNRNGRGGNDSSTIFVRGAQPVIVGNTFRGNVGNVISINANSLKSDQLPDYGRSTGYQDITSAFVVNASGSGMDSPLVFADALSRYFDNSGPLVRLNLMDGNGTNGMNVRGELLTIESVWDDTDIVHVLRSDVVVSDLHVYGGLRLQSNEFGSLVVKATNGAQLIATGDPLDIADRIGGTVQVIGRPGFPVILTSLADDTVGASFDLNGFPQTDTDGVVATPAPNDWGGIELRQYSNDRNVATILEEESVATNGNEENNNPAKAQFLGVLAPNENSGDENRRLGFEVHGFISGDDPGDTDVYSFQAMGQTEVWLDIDRTTDSLDTQIEVIDSLGNVLARATNNVTGDDAGTFLIEYPLTKADWLGGDYYTSNYLDAGMRVVLNGSGAALGTYFVRVTSEGGQTSGRYQMQIRVNQVDEKPGSTVRGAEIRYATVGVNLVGLPDHSPLLGESAEDTTVNGARDQAQDIGHLLVVDKNTISVAGNLSAADDIDFYTFTVDFEQVQAIGGFSDGGKTFATIFDLDWADGIGRADTTIAVYDVNGQLLYIGRDSDIADDQPAPGQGNDLNDLSRGTVGKLDPYIGPVLLPAGATTTQPEVEGVSQTPPSTETRYYVAVASNGQLPTVLNQYFVSNAAAPLTRLEPVNSVDRVVEDHIGFTGYTSNGVPVTPTTDLPLFDITDEITLQANVKPFTLSDVTLFVSVGGGLYTIDPFNGGFETFVGNPGNNTGDLDMRSDGRLYSVNGSGNNGGSESTLIELNTGTAGAITSQSDGIPGVNVNSPTQQQNNAGTVDAVVFRRNNFASYDRVYYAVRSADISGSTPGVSKLYRATSTGSASFTQNANGAIGTIQDMAMTITTITSGLEFFNGILYGVSEGGQFYQVAEGNSPNNSNGNGIQPFLASNVVDFSAQVPEGFAGLANAPENVENGTYANLLFAISTSGRLVAIDPATGTLKQIFDSNGDGVADTDVLTTFLPFATGLAFSPLDINLWHPTETRGTDPGHGINAFNDNTRTPTAETLAINGRALDEGQGGISFYFGLEEWTNSPITNDAYIGYQTSTGQLGVLNSTWQRDLTAGSSNGSQIGNNYNLPGGAYGSLQTNSFSLEGYRGTDKPTLYFNYFLETEGAASKTNLMRDSARVEISRDNGLTWELLATNNSTPSAPDTPDAELPAFLSTSRLASDKPNQQVQDLFDNTGTWRQARVDLNDYAGEKNLILRFDFSTSGVSGDPNNPSYVPADGDAFGNFNNRLKDQNNAFEGFYVDDIIVGFAERGEVATFPATTNVSTFFAVPQDPDPAGDQQQLNGEYQLEIRRGEQFAYPVMPTLPDLFIFSTIDTNDRLTPAQTIFTADGPYINDGDTITVDAGVSINGSPITVTFEFDLNGGGVSGTNTPVVYTLDSDAADVAAALAAAINASGMHDVIAEAYTGNTQGDRVNILNAQHVTGTLTPIAENMIDDGVLVDTGDTPAGAYDTTLTTNSPGFWTAFANLGDSGNGDIEVDYYQVQLNAGDRLVVDISTFGIDLFLRIFDLSTLTELASADNGQSLNDLFSDQGPFLIFNAPATDTYLIAVSGGNPGVSMLPQTPNRYYDPAVDPGVDPTTYAPGDTGFYQIDLEVGRPDVVTIDAYDQENPIDLEGNTRSRGDTNLHRQQGVVIIENNLIRNVGDVGIQVSPGARNAGTNVSQYGAPRATPTLNNDNLVTGLFIANNVVAEVGNGGISIQGEVTAGGALPQAAIPVVKVVNNTIYGGASRAAFGIEVDNNVAPTLINNIIVNTNTAIPVAASSAGNDGQGQPLTVVQTTLFSNNGALGRQGNKSIVLNPGDPLFVDPTTFNFYLEAGSPAIDSSLNTLGERTAISAVLSPLGIPDSEVVAPRLDLYGQLRDDDPSQNSFPGLGSNIVKDRGAIDRVDFIRGMAVLVVPEDNGTDDLDPTDTVVHIDQPSFFNQIIVRLTDLGIGIDDATVDPTGSQFVLTQTLRTGTTTLVEGTDYVFAYNSNTNEAILTSVTTFPQDARYTLTVDNSTTSGIRDLAGNELLGNQLDGTILFSLLVTNGANDPPVNTVPSSQSVPENTAAVPTSVTFSSANGNAITVDDPDAFISTNELQITLTASNGTISLSNPALVDFAFATDSYGSPQGDGVDDVVMTFRGTITALNTALDGLVFVPTLNFNGNAGLTITTSDLGNFGSEVPPTEMLDTDSVLIVVTPVNSAPVATSPMAVTATEDIDFDFTNTVSVSDAVDGDLGDMLVTISVDQGTLTLSQTTGLTFQNMETGADEASISFTGTVANINAALTGLLYHPYGPGMSNLNFNGTATLTLTVDDQGNTGAGSPLTSMSTTTITIDPVNDAPVVSLNGSEFMAVAGPEFDGLERQNFVFDNANGSLISVSDVDTAEDMTVDSGKLEVTLTATNGVIILSSTANLNITAGADGSTTVTFDGLVADINAALDGMIFRPDMMFVTPDAMAGPFGTVQVDVNDGGRTGSGGTLMDSELFEINVREVNDAPVITFANPIMPPPVNLGDPDAQEFVSEDTTLTFSSMNMPANEFSVGDSPLDPVPGVGDTFQVTLTVNSGSLTLSGISGLDFSFVMDPDGVGTGDGTADATMTFRGDVADINAALDGLVYTPNANFFGADTLTITVNDLGHQGAGGSKTATGTIALTVNDVNDDPQINAPTLVQAVEDTPLTFSPSAGNGITVSDLLDDPTGTGAGMYMYQLTLNLTDGDGTLTLATTVGLNFVFSDADGTGTGDGVDDVTMTFRGTKTDINAALNGLIYTPPAGVDGQNRSLDIELNDLGNVGLPGMTAATDGIVNSTVTIQIDGNNDAPVNVVPGAQTVAEDNPLIFSTGNGNAITVTDLDAGGGVVQVTLTSTNGVLTLGNPALVDFAFTPDGQGGPQGDGFADAAMTFRGTLGNINTALEGLTFTPVMNFAGPAQIQINTNDLGNSGVAPNNAPLSDIDIVGITVTPENDPPVVTTQGPLTVAEDTDVTISAANGNRVAVNDVDLGSGKLLVTLTVDHGTLQLFRTTGLVFSTGDGIGDRTMTFSGGQTAVNLALDGMIYTPDPGYVGMDNLAVMLDDQGSTGNGGPMMTSQNVAITVTPVNDAPALGLPTTQSINEDATLVFAAVNGNSITVSDVDVSETMGGQVQVSLGVSHGALTLSTTSGLSFSFSDVNGTSAGDGTADAAMTFRGTVNAVNVALSGLRYIPTANYNSSAGAESLTVSVNDLGNTGSGGAKTASGAIAISVSAVNDAPVNSLQMATASVEEDAPMGPLVFSTGNSNLISVSDVDVLTAQLVQVMLSVNHGTLSLNGTSGLSFSFSDANGTGAGTGSGNASMTFRGTLADINAALDGLDYTPAPDFSGNDTLTVTSNDLGQNGSGGAKTDTDTLMISVSGVNDTPVAVPDSFSVLVGGSVTGNVLTNDTDVDGPALAVVNPLVSLPTHGMVNMDFVTGQFTYTPDAMTTATSDSFQYTVKDTSGELNAVGNTVTVTISINAAPVITGGTLSVAENSGSGTLVGTVSVSDPNMDNVSLAIIAGNTSSAFAIDNSGNITVNNPAALDFETSPTFTLTVRATDDAATPGSSEATVTINLSDQAEAVTFDAADFAAAAGNVTVRRDGTKVRFVNSVTGFDIPGAPAHEFANVTSISFIGQTGGSDKLTVDFATGNPLPAGGLSYNGGSGAGIDTLVLEDGGAASFASVTHTFTSGSAGTIDVDGQIISYTGLEPIADNLSAASRVFNFGPAADSVLISDSSNGDGVSMISSMGTSESVTFETSGSSVTVNLGDGNDSLQATGLDSTFNGTLTVNAGAGADVVDLSGISTNAIINGDDGNDTLTGGSGNDQVVGNAGDDIVRGGTGDDVVLGGAGRDTVSGGAGNNVVDGNGTSFDVLQEDVTGTVVLTDGLLTWDTGSNTLNRIESIVLIGGSGDDNINASGFTQYGVRIEGGDGNDSITGTALNDVIFGDSSNTSIVTGGNDSVSAGSGNDIVFGGVGNDLLIGNAGDDQLNGDDGNDRILGGAGVDTMAGGLGNDDIDGQGATGDVMLVIASGTTVTVNAGSISHGAETDIHNRVERIEVTLSDGADHFNGGDYTGRLFVYALGGDDTILGGLGADVIFAGDGNDIVDGRDGNDIVYAGAGADAVRGGAGIDRLIGNADDDTLLGSAGNDFLFGGAGRDLILGEDGDDLIKGQGGRDNLAGGGNGTTATAGDVILAGTGDVIDDAFSFDFDALLI